MSHEGGRGGRACAGCAALLLFGAALVTAASAAPSPPGKAAAQAGGQEAEKAALKAALSIYQSQGEEGLHEWAKANGKRVPEDWITRWAERGAKVRDEDLVKAALVLAEEQGSRKCLASAFLSAGDYYLFVSEYGPAKIYYDQALSLYLRLQDLVGQGNVYRREGDICLRTAEDANALSLYDRALPLLEKARDPAGQAHVWLSKGNLFARAGESEQALAMLEKAMGLFEKARDVAGVAEVYKAKGDVHLYAGEKEQALEMYRKALPLFEQVEDAQNQGSLYFRQGLIYFDTSDDEKALSMFERALPFFEKTRDPRGQASVYKNEGQIYFTAGEHAKALEMYEKALPLFEGAREMLGLANVYRAEGEVYQSTGEYDKALTRYERSLKIYEQAQSPFRANVYLSKGDTFLLAGRPSDALEMYQKALSLYEEAEFPWGQAIAHRGEGDVYYAAGEDAKALAAYEKARELFEQVQDSIDLATVYRGEGKVHARAGDWSGSVACFNQALVLDRLSGAKVNEAATLADLMSAWEERSPSLAILYGKRSIILYQAIRANLRTFEKESQDTYRKLVAPTYRSLADLLISQGRLPEAQQVLDLLKDEEHFEFIRRDAAPSGPTQSLVLGPGERTASERMDEVGERLAALGKEYGDLKAKRERTDEEEQRYAELARALRDARQEFAAFQDQLAEEFAAQSQTKEREKLRELQGAGSLQRVLRTMPDRCAVVYTVVLEERTWVVLATPEVETRALCPVKAEELRSKVALFQAALQYPEMDPRPLGKELYDLLVAPIEKDLRSAGIRTLLWSLDDVLRYVPMAALWDGHRYLAERYRSVVLTSAKELLAEPASPNWRAAGMGSSTGKTDEGFRALPSVPEELRAIVREGTGPSEGVLPGVVRLDADFTQEALGKALRDGYAVVHLASHYKFQPGYADDSFLLLGDGSHLDLLQIQSLDFGEVELVTLSACETAVGAPGADGREVDGLGATLQERGAKSVIATLWPVADQSTALLMREFYRRREEHPELGKAEALRQAQMGLLHGSAELPDSLQTTRGGDTLQPPAQQKPPQGLVRFKANSDAPYAHPYFWAPFILLGNWR